MGSFFRAKHFNVSTKTLWLVLCWLLLWLYPLMQETVSQNNCSAYFSLPNFSAICFRQLTFTTVSYLLIFYLSQGSKPKRCIELAIASFRSNKLQKIFKLKIEQPVSVEDLGFISFFFWLVFWLNISKKSNYVWVKISLKTECWL